MGKILFFALLHHARDNRQYYREKNILERKIKYCTYKIGFMDGWVAKSERYDRMR